MYLLVQKHFQCSSDRKRVSYYSQYKCLMKKPHQKRPAGCIGVLHGREFCFSHPWQGMAIPTSTLSSTSFLHHTAVLFFYLQCFIVYGVKVHTNTHNSSRASTVIPPESTLLPCLVYFQRPDHSIDSTHETDYYYMILLCNSWKTGNPSTGMCDSGILTQKLLLMLRGP